MQPYRQMPCHKAYAIFHICLFYDRKIPLTAFRTSVIKAVDFNDFQFYRNKDKLTANKLFSNLNQRCITDRTNLIFFWKIKIFICYRNHLETLGIRCSVFSFFRYFCRKCGCQFFSLVAAEFCSISASLKRFNCHGKSTGCFSLEVPKSFLWRRLISASRLSLSCIRVSSRLLAASTVA